MSLSENLATGFAAHQARSSNPRRDVSPHGSHPALIAACHAPALSWAVGTLLVQHNDIAVLFNIIFALILLIFLYLNAI